MSTRFISAHEDHQMGATLPLTESWLLLFLTTLLVAICEEPFFSRAGIRQHALFHAMAANIVSTLVGCAMLLLAVLDRHAFGFLLLCSVPVSIFSEGRYLQGILAKRSMKLRWKWLVAGNVFTMVVLMIVQAGADVVHTQQPQLVFRVERNLDRITWGLGVAGILLLVFWMRGFYLPHRPSEPAEHSNP